LLVKAIFVPSGDQAGPPSSAGSFVRLVCPLPLAFMTKISPLPGNEVLRLNAIIVLSGDQAGPRSTAVLFVTLVGWLPSAFMTKISWLPVR
jgi:hypothetical protein